MSEPTRLESERDMWMYWRDKYGVASALRDYCPETLKANPELLAALERYEAAEAELARLAEQVMA